MGWGMLWEWRPGILASKGKSHGTMLNEVRPYGTRESGIATLLGVRFHIFACVVLAQGSGVGLGTSRNR